ncbi:MAG: hypothetical protein ABW076_10765 [Candidatus Thiodiazotropha sp.]
MSICAEPWTFSQALEITPVISDGVFHHLDASGRRRTATGEDGVGMTWEDGRDGTPRVYFTQMPRVATTFEPSLRISGDGEAYEPSLVALHGGRYALSALVFSLSAVSIHMLVERKVDVLTAAATSWKAVTRNPRVMARWAFIIALLTIVGMATAFIGLLVTMPLLGHASWHAYKESVKD